MNKIFKVIWSKARNCYVVVSELAKSHDDGHVRRSRSGCCRKAAVLAAFVLTTSLLAAPDWAQAAATNTNNPTATGAVKIENNGDTNTAKGNDAYATYDSQGNLIVGKDNQVSPIQKDPTTGNARSDKQAENVALGTRNGIGKFTHSTETKKPISGDESYAYQKLDTEWITVKVYNPDKDTYDDKQVEVYKLTPGQYMDDEYNVRAKVPTLADYNYNQEAYNQALNVYNSVANYLNDDRTRKSYYVSGSTAVGVDNVAEGDHSTAIGNKAKVLNSVGSYYVDAYGRLTREQNDAYYYLDEQGRITTTPQYVKDSNGQYVRDTTGNYIKTSFLTIDRLIDSTDAVAVGSDVTAEGRSAVAIGHESYAKEYSVAIGENSVTDYMGVAIGKDNKAKYASTAIGHTNDANGYYTATLGVNNTARADESTAIGYGNSVDGQQRNGGTTPKATYTHVLGSNNTVKGSYNAVFGDTNTVTGAYALALGGHNKISGENTNDGDGEYGIAIGYGNTVEKNALALGLNSNSIHDGSIAIGKSVNTTGDNNNGATDSIAIGTKASVHMKNGIVLGNEAYAGNNGDNNEGAIAIGHQAKSAAGESIAIGTKATTGNNSGSTGMKNIGAIAIGSNTNADTVYDIAMGVGASTTNTVNGGAIALGHNATIEQGGQASAAIGDSARVKMNLHDAVALGSQAYADREANNQGGYDPASNNKNHNAGSNPVWNSTLAAVSVGSSDHDVWDGSKNVHYAQQTRQITNVAAGKEDTDAVNVAQLKQVVNLVNNSGGGSGTGGSGVHDYSVKSVDSANDSNYNNTGATGSNALAAGVNASATGENAVAIGTGATAEGKGATVIGQYAKAKGDYATAFGGSNTDTTGEAVGNTADGANSVAFGERTSASGPNSTAFGWRTTATEKRATAFGERTTASGANSTAFGQLATASGQNSVAFGNEAVANNYGSTAFGNRTEALGEYSTAFGNSTVAAGMNTAAFGTDNVAGAVLDENGAYTNIIYKTNPNNGRVDKDTNGNPIELSREKMDARGNLAYLDGSGNTKSVTYTVSGGETHSYVLLQGKDGNTYIRDYRGNIRSATIGSDGKVTVGDKELTNVTLKKANAGANGYHILSNANATVWGENSIASGEASTAFGVGSTASGKNSLAVGGATASLDDSIALGKGSVTTRAKYSALTKDEEKKAYAKGASTGSAWEATDNAIAVGNDSKVTRQITGVAAGSLDTDAVNVAQLKAVDAKHTTVSVGGTHATADNTAVKGGNLELTRTTNGQANYDVSLSKDVVLGEQEENKGGSLVVNSVAQFRTAPGSQETYPVKEAVKIDGTTVSVVKNDGTNDQRQVVLGVGQDTGGYVALFEKTGKTPTYIFNAISSGITYLKDSQTYPADQANEFNRLEYGDITNGSTQFIATLDDGLKFSGDQGTTSAVKLNQKLTVTGGETNPDNLATANNIGVVSSQDGDNGKLEIKLNKDLNLGNNGSVTMGNTTINDGGMTITKKEGDKTTTVSLTDKGLDNGGNKITHVAAGDINDTSTDAVNGSQLNDVKTLAGKHTKVTVEGGTAAGTTDYAGENLKLKVTDDNGQKTYDLKLSDKLSVGGKDGQDGHIGVNGADGKSGVGIDGKDGISIKGKDGNDGVTIKGIDGKDGVHGAEGHIGLNGKDGMTDIWTKPGTPGLNGKDGETMTRIVYKNPNGQEHEAATLDDGLKFGGDFGTTSAVKLDKQVNVKGNAKNESDLTDGNIGVVSSQDGDNGQLLVKLNKDLNLGNNGSVKMGNTTINNGGVTIQPSTGDATKSVSLTNKGLDNGGNKITNVAAGEISDKSTDAVNGSQLNTVKTLAGQHTTVEAGSKNISVTESTNSTGGKKYTVDLAKDVTFGDAAQDDKTVAISGTKGTVTAGTGDNKVTVDGSKGQIVAGGNNGVKIGNIENGDSSLTIYDKDGKATGKTDKAGKYVTNLDNKTWKDDGSYVSGRAATEDQLHQVESNVNKQIADVNTKIDKVDKHHTEVTVNGGTAAKADGSYTDGNLQIAQKTGSDGQKIYDLKLSDNLNIGGAGKDGKDGQNGHMGINGADGKSGIGIDGEDGISIKGKDGKDGVTIKGIDGKNGTEGHIGLTGSAGKDGQNASADIHVKNGQVGVDGTDGNGGKAGMDRVVYEDHNHVTHEVATMDDGMKYSGDSGNAAVKLNKNVQIYGGATEYADGNNIGVVASQDGDNAKLQVKLAKDLKGINSIEAKTITTGDTTMDNSGLTVKGDDNHKDITIHQGNVNMGGNKVSGVADGKVSKDSTDAVNGSQLWQRDQAINGLSGSVNKLGNRINRVGAGAAALAALHPLDFDPDDKWDFAAGYGNYRGANAAAVGAYYRPNEDTMFSIGGSFGGGENMVNAGVSIKLGQGNHVSTSRVAMAKEIKDLRQNVANLNAIVNRQSALIDKLTGTDAGMIKDKGNDLFPDVPANHWAYEYVTKLKHAGILTGYPDGNFDGDRMMTRYEFAAIVYRAIMAGAASNPALNQDGTLDKLANEFSSEMKYIRIDTIAKDKNGKPTIERVRVISDAK